MGERRTVTRTQRAIVASTCAGKSGFVILWLAVTFCKLYSRVCGALSGIRRGAQTQGSAGYVVWPRAAEPARVFWLIGLPFA